MKQLVRLEKSKFLSSNHKASHIVPSHKHGMQIAMEFSGETSLERGHTWRLVPITSMLGDQSTAHIHIEVTKWRQ